MVPFLTNFTTPDGMSSMPLNEGRCSFDGIGEKSLSRDYARIREGGRRKQRKKGRKAVSRFAIGGGGRAQSQGNKNQTREGHTPDSPSNCEQQILTRILVLREYMY